MARKTMEKKFADAKKKYESELEVLGAELQKALAAEIAKLIPKGWYVAWHQSDQQYDDENYYFGLDQQTLCSVKMPRKGKLLKEAVETTYKMVSVKSHYYPYTAREEKQVDKYGTEAEYEWHLDEACKKDRPKTRENAYEEDAGVIDLDEDCDDTESQFDVTEEQLSELRDALQGIDDEDYERAFGDEATVRIYADGTVEVD